MKGLWPFHQQSAGPALPVRGAAENRFLYQFVDALWDALCRVPFLLDLIYF